MTKADLILHWIAVSFYALSSCLFLVGYAFKKENLYKFGLIAAIMGLIPHSAALGYRWYESGHGPYLRRYEVISSDVWIGLVMFLIVQKFAPVLKKAAILVLPASFLLIGMGIMSSNEIKPLPETYHTFWLIVHISFAKLSYGSALIGTALAIMTIRQEKKSGYTEKAIQFDQLSYKFIAFSFLNIAIMIAAGAIWAEKAWGSYWSWDPVEVWSLVSWIIYGIYLHLRRVHGWRGKKASYFALFAFGILLFAILGIGLIYATVHSPYFS